MKRLLALVILLLVALAASGQDAPPKKAPLEERIAGVLPRPAEEKWLKIAWRSDLARGRFEANAAGKPIFLWLMDGDPMGCT
jgi:hypothetical protein